MSVIASVSDARHEVVDGLEVEVSPPTPAHGRAQVRIGMQLFAALRTDPTLEVFTDLHVRLAPGLVRRPDAAVARRERLDDAVEAQPAGAVLLVVEVLSPSTALIDLRDKMTEYAAAGIPGYLVVDPRGRPGVAAEGPAGAPLLAHTLVEGHYELGAWGPEVDVEVGGRRVVLQASWTD